MKFITYKKLTNIAATEEPTIINNSPIATIFVIVLFILYTSIIIIVDIFLNVKYFIINNINVNIIY